MATTVDTLLVRIEADMADLKRDLARIGNQSEKVGSRMENSFNKAGRALTALVGAAGLLQFGKGVANTGMQVDALRIKMETMFGSAEQGAEAFDALDTFASKVPFSLREISMGAGPLSVVAGEAKNMNELLQITGNIAAITGRPFNEMAVQVQRAMSAGVNSAEILKEDGIAAMMGFQMGATVSVEETVRALQENFGTGGKFDGVMNKMSKTAQGSLSMLGDAFFQMQKSIFDSGLNDAIVQISSALRNIVVAATPALSLLGSMASTLASVLAPALQLVADNMGALIALVTILTVRFVALRAAAVGANVAIAAMPFVGAAAGMVKARLAAGALAVKVGGLSSVLMILKSGISAILVVLRTLITRLFLPIAILVGFAKLANGLYKIWQRSKDLGDMFKNLKEVLSAFVENAKDRFEVVVNKVNVIRLRIKQLFLGLVQQIGQAIVDSINVIVQKLNESQVFKTLGFDPLQELSGPDMSKVQAATEELTGAIKELDNSQKDAEASGSRLRDILVKFGLIKPPPKEADPEKLSADIGSLTGAVGDAKEKLDPIISSTLSAVQSMSQGISNAFADMLTSGKFNMDSLKDVFRSFVKTMIAKAIELFIVNKILGSLFGLPTTTFASGATVLGKVATGGAVNANQPYLVGERGPELIVPNSASTVMNSNNTRSALGGGDSTTIVQNINISTGVQQTVRSEIRSLMPEIANSAKAAVADGKRRGGSYGRAFA